MAEVLIVYATHLGNTQRVAERVADAIRAAGHGATVAHVDAAPAVAGFDAAILGAPMQTGELEASVVAYARCHADALEQRPNGFYSVSLAVEQDDDASRDAVDRCLLAFQRDTGWRPDVIASYGGAQPVTRFSLLHRALMRHAAAAADDPTADGPREHVYAGWDAVEGFVEAFLDHLRRARNTPSAVSSARPASI